MVQIGLYEKLINKIVVCQLNLLDKNTFFVKEEILDKNDAGRVLTMYLTTIIESTLMYFNGEDQIKNQIDLSNKIIHLLQNEIKVQNFDNDLIDIGGKMLKSVFSKTSSGIADYEKRIKEITPYTGLSQSELFTGNNAGISLESELKKEILSSDSIDFLVSFIKWTGIRIFDKELREFTDRGGRLRIITTSYMGATDLKAIEYLSELKNTEIKISYNTNSERLHAKAYLFIRDTGFHTGYIGSSNISRSALTNGLEWNMKVTTQEVSHIIDKFQKTFETYWKDSEFEYFEKGRDSDKLKIALKNAGNSKDNNVSMYFELQPFPFQKEILEKLEVEREIHNSYRNLIVAATGTGKTVISAFDYKRFAKHHPKAKLLFVAHRKEILEQAQATFRGILRDNNFGDLMVDGIEPDNFDFLFASVQSLNSKISQLKMNKSFYDYIVIDEVHHIAANSYRPILKRFTPKVLLGLTATPERMDGEDILLDFNNKIAAEIRLPEALNRKLLCPFQYFGITDNVDLSNSTWQNGRYLPSELSKIYTQNDDRTRNILNNLNKYLNVVNDVRALCFCITQEHAQFMAEKFTLAGLKADYLVSSRSNERHIIRKRFANKEINYLFVVDIFNEGVDVPEIDTILFLRPTESLTVFLQQLGRGLRLTNDKECLTVLDFVGNARPEYDFEGKFRVLIGKTTTSILKEVEDNFPHLPLGCTIILERIAKESILNNIRNATSLNVNQVVLKIQNYKHQTTLPLTLRNFTGFYNLPLQLIYKKKSWKRLCAMASVIDDFTEVNEPEIYRFISKKLFATRSSSYFHFILELAKKSFIIKIADLTEIEKKMCLMLHYDVWQIAGLFATLEESIKAIGKNEILVEEIIEVLEILINDIDFIESKIQLPYNQPLQLHSRYTRDQILAAFDLHTFEKKFESREGVVYASEKNTELLFVTLNKSEKDFSSSTLYKDYAISESLFHWQSQNSASPEKGKGLAYINHQKENRKILIFVRERNEDEYGIVMGSVFLGEVNLVDHNGSKPMNITWELQEPMPPYLWKDAAKMAVG